MALKTFRVQMYQVARRRNMTYSAIQDKDKPGKLTIKFTKVDRTIRVQVIEPGANGSE